MTTHLNGGRTSLRIAAPIFRAPRVAPRPAVAREAQQTIMIYLRNANRYVTLYRADYDRIVAQTGTNIWFVGYNSDKTNAYVRAWSTSNPRKMVMLARIISDAPPRTAVRYRDHDAFNLRSENLTVDLDGGSGGVKRRRKGTVNAMATREKTRAAFAALKVSNGLGIAPRD